MDWQPIDTAPTTNSDYLFARIAWGPDDDRATGDGMRYKGHWFVAGLFYRGGGREQRQYEYREIVVVPTHWAPSFETPNANLERTARSDGTLQDFVGSSELKGGGE